MFEPFWLLYFSQGYERSSHSCFSLRSTIVFSDCIHRVSNTEIAHYCCFTVRICSQPYSFKKRFLFSSFNSTVKDNALSTTSVVTVVCIGFLLSLRSMPRPFSCASCISFILSSIGTSTLTLTPRAAACCSNCNIPVLSWRWNALAVENIMSISSSAFFTRSKPSFCISQGSRITSTNSRLAPYSISFILCLASIALFHNVSKKYCCSTNVRTVLIMTSLSSCTSWKVGIA